MQQEDLKNKVVKSIKIEKFKNFLSEIFKIVGAENLIYEAQLVSAAVENNQGVKRTALGMAYPCDVSEVEQIVQLANKYKVPLYPVSMGKNMGYGGLAPVMNGQFILNLSKMNRIIDYDHANGEVTVEPGVTQEQLSRFLIENGDKFWPDVTGASPQASILGNTLESGFGHTPLGDHRKHIVDMEVVLGNGKLLQCGEFPNLGPNTSGLFIQSNFGIVTKLRIPLFKIPEHTESYVIKFKNDSSFKNAALALTKLRHNGVIDSLVHIANSTRILMTQSTFPSDVDKSNVLSAEDSLSILNRSPLKAGMWTAVGGVYGTKKEVKIKIKAIKKAIEKNGHGKIMTFSDKKIDFLLKVCNLPVFKNFEYIKAAKKSLESFKPLHGLTKGKPTNQPNENIFWRTDNIRNLGLIWYAPIINATSRDINDLNRISHSVFKKYGFELPITLTMISHKKMIAVINFSFDKSIEGELERAQKAHDELAFELESHGFSPYRIGLLRSKVHRFQEDKQFVLDTLKKSLDPNNIIAPGRYGIGRNPGLID